MSISYASSRRGRKHPLSEEMSQQDAGHTTENPSFVSCTVPKKETSPASSSIAVAPAPSPGWGFARHRQPGPHRQLGTVSRFRNFVCARPGQPDSS